MTRITATLLTVLIAPAPLFAQGPGAACNALGNARIGHWVEYTIDMAGEQGPTQIRQALVDKETVRGEEFLWFETRMPGPQGVAVIQMLVPAYPFEPTQVEVMIMQMGAAPPMRLPPQMMQAMRSQMGENPMNASADQCASAEIVGWEEVTVPAGTFRALHLRPTDDDSATDVWVSPDVPFGMVKVILGGDDGGEVVLTGHGDDATSSIRERPGG